MTPFKPDLFDSEPPNTEEDITSTTLKAITSPNQDSTLALFRYMRRKLGAIDKRLGKVEARLVFVMGGAAALTVALEVYRAFFAPHH